MTGLEQRPRVETNIQPGKLHEALVLCEFGEQASVYVRAQLLSKAFEAIGLSALTVVERPVDGRGRVIDFDGRPMIEKTRAALDQNLPDFERDRREADEVTAHFVDKLKPGETLVEDSKHPDVVNELADMWGYHSGDRFLMKRLYQRTEDSLILYNYNIRHGMGLEGITRRAGSGLETIEGLLEDYDKQVEETTGIPHFLGEIWVGGNKDYGEVQRRRELAESKAERHLSHFQELLLGVGRAYVAGDIDETEAKELQRQYERGFHTLLLVELNPERAKLELSDLDYELMRLLTMADPELSFGGAYGVAERNKLTFIACGDATRAFESENAWHGGEIKIGRCINCNEGPKEVGVESWCRDCIKGHCG